MKRTGTARPFVFRIALLIAALIPQFICVCSLPSGAWPILLYTLKCLNACILILLAFSLFCIWRNRAYPYICVVLDGIGLFISFFAYQNFIEGFSGTDLSGLQKFILGPYLICSIPAWAIWLAAQRKGWGLILTMVRSLSGHKDHLKRVLSYFLIILSVVFLLTGIYLFTLESFLLAGWAVLTCALMFYAARKAR